MPSKTDLQTRRDRMRRILDAVLSRDEFNREEIMTLCEESRSLFVNNVLKQLSADHLLGRIQSSQEDAPPRFAWIVDRQRFDTEHWIHQLTGKIRVRRDGEFVDATAFEEIPVDYPGVGQVTTHTVGHPEPITLPLFRPEIRNSWNVMNMPPYVIEPLRWVAGQVDAGKMNIDEATDQVNEVLMGGGGWFKLLMSTLGRKMFVQYVLASRKTIPYIASLFAYAVGTKDGMPRRVGTRLSAVPFGGMKNETMGGVTGVPLATALAMFAKGKIDRRGVFAPEGAIDPDAFFDELAPLCTPKKKNAKELVQIDISG